MPHFDSDKIKKTVSFSIILYLLASFLWFLSFRYWSDSEIWGLRQAAACHENWRLYACDWKPAFHLLSGTLQKLFLDSSANLESVLLLNRVVTGLAWISLCFLWIATKRSPLLFIGFLGSSFFFLDLSVARADLWALPFIVASAVELQREKEPRAWLLIALVAMALLVSPKMILAVLCLFPLIWGKARLLLKAAKSPSSAFALVVSVIGLGFSLNLSETFEFFLNLFTKEQYGFGYFDPLRWSYLSRGLAENPHWLIMIAVILWSARRQISALFPAFLAILLMLGAPDKLPYFLGVFCFLFFFLSAPMFKPPKPLAILIGVLAVINSFHWISHFPSWSNKNQKVFLTEIQEASAKLPYLVIFDSLGLLGHQDLPSIFIGPGQNQMSQKITEHFKEQKFDLVLMSRKIQTIEHSILPPLKERALNPVDGVWIRSVPVEVQNLKAPQQEIREKLNEEFAPHFTSQSHIAVVFRHGDTKDEVFFGERSYLWQDLPSLERACQGCKKLEVRVSPFGSFLQLRSGILSQTPLPELFSFEPEAPRRPLISLF